MVEVGLDGSEFFVEDIDLVLQLSELRLNLDIWSGLLQGPLELIDLVVQLLLLILFFIACGQQPLLFVDLVLEFLHGVILALAGLPQLVVPSL